MKKTFSIVFIEDDRPTFVTEALADEKEIYRSMIVETANDSSGHGNSKPVLVMDFCSEEMAANNIRPLERNHEFRSAMIASRFLGFNFNKVSQVLSAERAAMEAKKENGRAEVTLRGVTLCYAEEYVV